MPSRRFLKALLKSKQIITLRYSHRLRQPDVAQHYGSLLVATRHGPLRRPL
ncbi:hypothetical protein EDC15_1097 [Acetobacter aceti NBRC 14818]|nr:hypothetical protein EDC15_1097 [Acetobacter aceti NBRC 14818]